MLTNQLSNEDWRRVLSIVIRQNALPKFKKILLILRLAIIPITTYLFTRIITSPNQIDNKSFILLNVILLTSGEIIAKFILIRLEQFRHARAVKKLSPNFNLTRENTRLLNSEDFYIFIHNDTQIIPIQKDQIDWSKEPFNKLKKAR